MAAVINNVVASWSMIQLKMTGGANGGFPVADQGGENADRISKYEIKDNNLVRLDKNNQSLVLLEGVESASFTTKKTLPNLLTVRIFPADKKEIPFFTSFALRGLNNDMQ